MQLNGEAQAVGPVQSCPPHCPNSVCVGPDAEVVVLPGLLTVVVLVGPVVVAFAVVVAGGPDAPGARP